MTVSAILRYSRSMTSLRLPLRKLIALLGLVWLATASTRAAQPLTVDDADVVAPGDLEFTVGHFRGVSAGSGASEGFLDLVFGVLPAVELGWSAELDRWQRGDHALALKAVSHPGVETGGSAGLLVEHRWPRESARELGVAALFTWHTPRAALDTNLGLSWPMDGARTGSTAWSAGQAARLGHESGWGALGEVRVGGGLGSGTLDEAGFRLAATRQVGPALLALGLDRELRGPSETTVFLSSTFYLSAKP